MSDRERWAAALGLVAGIALAHIGWGAFLLGFSLMGIYGGGQ